MFWMAFISQPGPIPLDQEHGEKCLYIVGVRQDKVAYMPYAQKVSKSTHHAFL